VSTKAIREHAELLQYFGGADESKSFLDDRGGVQSLLREQATINRSTAQVLNHTSVDIYTIYFLLFAVVSFGSTTIRLLGCLGAA
jgi:hypothetical protein